MINRATGEVNFQTGLHIAPHCSAWSLFFGNSAKPKMITQNLTLRGWKRHILGLHASEHGTFEVEALSAEEDRIHVVLFSHQHTFYEVNTPNDADRRMFHEGVISSDLAGQREFKWGEVLCRLESKPNKDWLVIAYSREAKVPLRTKDVLFHLYAHKEIPEDNT